MMKVIKIMITMILIIMITIMIVMKCQLKSAQSVQVALNRAELRTMRRLQNLEPFLCRVSPSECVQFVISDYTDAKITYFDFLGQHITALHIFAVLFASDSVNTFDEIVQLKKLRFNKKKKIYKYINLTRKSYPEFLKLNTCKFKSLKT
ncbi:hypothetical protein RIR_jg30575.t1 [Rhizophagus irregularis DAOM 181602=DAOM 197198]|nr:hypothetical protein RIR_jg30575.t1 [Rhizophagus irregularis DAOM 181602=DAOM 197198]